MGQCAHRRPHPTKAFHYGRSASEDVCLVLRVDLALRNSSICLENAKIDFHGVFDGQTLRASGPGNGLVRAYLNKLGLSYEAIAYLTSASPTDMVWLHSADAKRLGIAAPAIAEGDNDMLIVVDRHVLGVCGTRPLSSSVSGSTPGTPYRAMKSYHGWRCSTLTRVGCQYSCTSTLRLRMREWPSAACL